MMAAAVTTMDLVPTDNFNDQKETCFVQRCPFSCLTEISFGLVQTEGRLASATYFPL
jgi:hypothetical protein